ncbi:DMT family transporter [Haloimpatiens sp. FM7330]|uniref:DMT family transporter n=1 Tax=Haloimpatiens sp. FM7330 TaxID=3298610 RepID=UPI00363770CE
MNNSKQMKGILYLVLSASSFGIMPVLAKLAYKQSINTYGLLFLRFLFATIMLGIYLLKNNISFKITIKQFLLIMFISIFGYSLTSITLFSSYNYISVGLATMILYTYPVIVTILSFILYKERVDKEKIISLLFCLLGVYTLVSIKNTNFNMKGILLAFLASLFFSLYVIGVSNKLIEKIDSYVITFYMSMIANVVVLLIGIGTKSLKLTINFYSFICIVLLAFISTIVALMTFIKGVKIVGPSKASIFSTLEPIVSLILGIIVLREPLTVNIIIGSILIVLSISILFRKSSTSI